MRLDQSLLKQAKEARDLVIEREYRADQARLTYQHAIRKLHASGGSLRDIAEALGLSHQRVHQIVEGVEGKVVLKGASELKSDRDEISCSFCGLRKSEVERVVAGPDAFICAGCIDLASEVVRQGEARSNERVAIALSEDPNASCRFCGKHTRSDHRLVVAGDSSICDECLALGASILVRERNR